MWYCQECGKKHFYDGVRSCIACDTPKGKRKRDTSDPLLSGVVGYATDSTILGTLVGGSIGGAIIGDLFGDGDLWD